MYVKRNKFLFSQDSKNLSSQQRWTDKRLMCKWLSVNKETAGNKGTVHLSQNS
jgi:hypothetical protein